jgi:uridine phosphorylase
MARRVLLPGDPGRALALAQDLLGDDRRMFNHNRGLWGYTGTAADGEPLTIQATGMGGPSAAIVLEELADLGCSMAIRIGTCGAIAGGLELGDLIAVSDVICSDGTSRALGSPERLELDSGLSAGLARHAGTMGTVVTCDLFYDPDHDDRLAEWRAAGAVAIEMEAAALAAVSSRRGVRFGCILAVSDVLPESDTRRRIGADALVSAGLNLGRAAYAASRSYSKGLLNG